MTSVYKQPDGTYAVCWGETVIQAGFENSSQAWRWVDRQEGDPINPSEKRAQYGFEMAAAESDLRWVRRT